ncbi:MAG TPA: helix-turn-helix domain-containing protein [Mycobacteriales bacterium]|nr:helix-turn-helix domain-containing protein [Mycobacteriales bacterium]
MAADEKPVSLAKAVRQRRVELRMTQSELARASDYSQESISKIESGAMVPNGDRLGALAKALGISIQDLGVDDHDTATPTQLPAVSKPRTSLARLPRLAAENVDRIADLHRRQELLEGRAEDAFRPLETAKGATVDQFLRPFLELVSDIDGLNSALPEIIEGLGGSAVTPNGDAESALSEVVAEQRQAIAATIVGQAAMGAVSGALAGGAAAAATYATVAAVASASTGTAIASLSGAAATNATLAAIGGGSVAAGGLGVAGGTMILTGIVAAPLVLGLGFAAARAGRQILDKEEERARHIDDAEAQIEAANQRISDAMYWAGQAQAFLIMATSRGSTMIREIRDGVVDETTTWDAMANEERSRVLALIELATVTMTVMPIPVFPTFGPEALSEGGADPGLALERSGTGTGFASEVASTLDGPSVTSNTHWNAGVLESAFAWVATSSS